MAYYNSRRPRGYGGRGRPERKRSDFIRVTGLFKNSNGHLVGVVDGKYRDALLDMVDRYRRIVFVVSKGEFGCSLSAAPANDDYAEPRHRRRWSRDDDYDDRPRRRREAEYPGDRDEGDDPEGAESPEDPDDPEEPPATERGDL